MNHMKTDLALTISYSLYHLILNRFSFVGSKGSMKNPLDKVHKVCYSNNNNWSK